MQNSKTSKFIVTLAVTFSLLMGSLFVINNAEAAQQRRGKGKSAAAKPADPRKRTTVQTATIAVGAKKNAVEVLYLNSPWGPTTFGYLENGGNDYYSNRTWPFAHLKINAAAKYEGKSVEPGDYILYINPKNESNKQMSVSLASFKPEAGKRTFLVNGDVFTETPENLTVITTKPVTFAKGAEVANALKIALSAEGSNVNINLHYGDRTLTEKLSIN
jgi:hypothetical protein